MLGASRGEKGLGPWTGVGSRGRDDTPKGSTLVGVGEAIGKKCGLLSTVWKLVKRPEALLISHLFSLKQSVYKGLFLNSAPTPKTLQGWEGPGQSLH